MKDFVFELTKIIKNGAWEPTIKPAIREYFSTGVDEDDRVVLQQWDRFMRIIVIELVSRTPEELGLHRTHEGLGSSDAYSILVKTTRQQDCYEIFGRIREICIAIPVTGIFNRIEFDNPVFTTGRGKWTAVFGVTAFRSGKVINVGD